VSIGWYSGTDIGICGEACAEGHCFTACWEKDTMMWDSMKMHQVHRSLDSLSDKADDDLSPDVVMIQC
jgi:hypothetical protein